jgi:hypothetical protein
LDDQSQFAGVASQRMRARSRGSGWDHSFLDDQSQNCSPCYAANGGWGLVVPEVAIRFWTIKAHLFDLIDE